MFKLSLVQKNIVLCSLFICLNIIEQYERTSDRLNAIMSVSEQLTKIKVIGWCDIEIIINKKYISVYRQDVSVGGVAPIHARY